MQVDPYDLPQGCSGKLPGAVLQPWGLCFGTQAVESTKLVTNVQNHYDTLQEELY